MSISIMTYAWRMPCAENSDKLVIMKLADHASDDGYCWPSWGHLVKHTGLSRATVARSLGRLEDAGVIRREPRPGTSTMYFIDVDKIKKMTPPDQRGHNSKGYQGETVIDPSHDETTPSHGETPGSLTVRPDPSHGETQIIREPKQEPKGTSDTIDVVGRLRSAWKVWNEITGSKPSNAEEFKKRWKPVVSKYNTSEISSAIRLYVGETDRRYWSFRRFPDDIGKYMKPKRVAKIDPFSDMPIDEQKKYGG